MKRLSVILILVIVAQLPSFAQQVLPSKDQIAWADAEIGVIIHLDINIFAPASFDYKKKETLPPLSVFNPSKLNTDQWVKTAKAAGAKYAILTVKHGTGFCLWPSAVHAYNVGHTPYQQDILQAFIASCKKYGLQPGLYYNTNTNTYLGTQHDEAYNKAVLAQLNEIWSNYGPMFEIWFDGGLQDGLEADVLKMIREKQPQAILFQGPLKAGNTIRWIGNEDGFAAYPQWSRANETTASDGAVKIDGLHGDPEGKYWCPGESDFPIRKNYAWNGGWLWKAGEDKDLFSVKELVEKYYKSVGRNTNMLVGMVVDTSGLIPKADSLVFDSFGRHLKHGFSAPLAQRSDLTRSIIELKNRSGKAVRELMIMEDLEYGENILSYSLQVKVHDDWKEVATGESVGHKRLQTFNPVAGEEWRLMITGNAGPLHIKLVALY
ncbi:alpha-L-fucosidase [Chitinophaga sancti]|uniref:alpha-L-fucosidase n=1 Tax=Chitinophaga sancti TaxID=1004 RepID=A0A1K1S1J9_9BACT|nr:alpha-L-fucosidase [Chitinophaga sancti]WQD59755.1 alpha-L-fucosidase [Chitinophaga sancti]WQG88114.1 alpha-L-fucosidase [Chitinophaga sancti]SFW77933.1 alpha-L-fucosidase [Chitinophaga sancti]